jgi:hypothetical protein
MVSPYLERPLRSYEEALRERAARHDEIGGPALEAEQTAPVATVTDLYVRDEAILSFDDMLSDGRASAFLLGGSDSLPIVPLDAAAMPVALVPLPELDLIDLGLPSFAFG